MMRLVLHKDIEELRCMLYPLTLEDRKLIQLGLEQGFSKAQIAKDIGKCPSNVTREVRLHRKFKLATLYRGPRYYCENSGKLKECYRCKMECPHFKERSCKRRERIGVRNRFRP